MKIYMLMLSILLSSCAAVSPAPIAMTDMMALDGVTVMTTGKTISDHVISYTSGKNCSTVRLQTGQNFCEEDDYSVPEEIYCYNSLGNVNCFSSPPPYGEKDKTVDQISGRRGLIR
ncbi:MAG: hypothetical protein ISQ90_09015 [Rhodospirillales bacterium]|nr:hypothetical protein [Rhodospirillales bacterium]